MSQETGLLRVADVLAQGLASARVFDSGGNCWAAATLTGLACSIASLAKRRAALSCGAEAGLWGKQGQVAEYHIIWLTGAMRMIEFRQLRFLIASVDHGTLHRAATALDIEQSTLSRSIAKLERVVGVRLLARSRTGVTPTPAGTEFIRSARPMIAMADRMLARTRLAGQDCGGCLTIGHSSSISAGHLRRVIEGFRQAFPDVETSPVEAPRDVLLAGLDTGVVDLMVMSGKFDHPSLRCEPVWNERLMASLPSNHRLSGQDWVTWADLRDTSIVLTAADPGPAIGDLVRSKLLPLSGVPAIKMLDTSRESMLSMLSDGQSISIHCACATGASYPGVTHRQVHDLHGQSWVRYSAYWRSENDNPALRRLLNFLRKRHSLSFGLP